MSVPSLRSRIDSIVTLRQSRPRNEPRQRLSTGGALR